MIPKFRGLSIAEHNNGEMVYGFPIVDRGIAMILNEVIDANDQYVTIGEWCSVDKDTVGQSTGLFDKNGKEIFEGDVISVIGELHTVFYDTEKGSFRLNPHDKRWNADYISNYAHIDNFEIIGNIYETPKLVKEATDEQRRSN